MAAASGFDVLRVLESVALLRTLSPAERKNLADHMVDKNFDVGDALMKEGEVGDSFFIIISVCLVRLSVVSAFERLLKLRFSMSLKINRSFFFVLMCVKNNLSGHGGCQNQSPR